jgi:hypothetical protein
MRAEQETDLMTASTGSRTRVDDADKSEHHNQVVIRVLTVATFVVNLDETIMINAIPLLSFYRVDDDLCPIILLNCDDLQGSGRGVDADVEPFVGVLADAGALPGVGLVDSSTHLPVCRVSGAFATSGVPWPRASGRLRSRWSPSPTM